MKEMKKSNLVNGHTIVELANGELAVFVEDFLLLSGSYEEEEMYSEGLEHCRDPKYNINKVKVFEYPAPILSYFTLYGDEKVLASEEYRTFLRNYFTLKNYFTLDNDEKVWDWVRPNKRYDS